MTDAVADLPNYPVIVTTDGQNYTLRIPKLHLIETGGDLAATHARIEARRRDLLDQYARLGATGELPAGDDNDGRVPDAGRAWQVFALKAGIVTLAVAIVVATAAFSFAYTVRGPLMGRIIIHQVEKGLLDAAKIELNPERAAKLRQLVANWVPYAKPYMAELRPLFAELCAPTPGAQ